MLSTEISIPISIRRDLEIHCLLDDDKTIKKCLVFGSSICVPPFRDFIVTRKGEANKNGVTVDDLLTEDGSTEAVL